MSLSLVLLTVMYDDNPCCVIRSDRRLHVRWMMTLCNVIAWNHHSTGCSVR